MDTGKGSTSSPTVGPPTSGSGSSPAPRRAVLKRGSEVSSIGGATSVRSEALERRGLSVTEVAVARVIARLSDEQGRNAHPSRKHIGLKVGGLKPKSVTSATSALVASGWLAKVHRSRSTPEGWRGSSNLYQLRMPAEFETQVPAATVPRKRGRRGKRHRASQAGPSHQRPATVEPPRTEEALDVSLVRLWLVAIAAMTEVEQRALAREVGLPEQVVTRPGRARSSSLAHELANRGPPPA